MQCKLCTTWVKGRVWYCSSCSLINEERKLRYARDWLLKKKGLLDKPKIEIDPRAKKNCILCSDFIDKEKYLQNGNFCSKCISHCEYLARLSPHIKIGNRDVEFYEKESKKFQESCTQKTKKRLAFLNKKM